MAGGAVGTALRLAIDAALPHGDDAFALSTLIINVLGSFALGFLVSRVWPRASSTVRAALGPGLIGSFTTFSAVMVSLVSLGAHDAWMPAALYLALTLLLGLGAAAAGLALGARATDGPGTPGPATPGPATPGPGTPGPGTPEAGPR